MLEPYDGKLSRTVLRREGGGNTADPADYSPLVNRLKGQVIKISPNSTQFINPMDINANYSEEDNPLSLKADFILSLCELVVGGKEGLLPVEKTVIDRCVHLIYRKYFANPCPENMPILEDLYNALLQQDEKEAHHVATALEIYVKGSLNLFNHRTNVNVNNRIVCYDIKELGKQMKKLGMLIVQDQVWGRVTANRSSGKSTRYYMDEMHLLLKEEQTAAYSVEIWKRFRKWGGIPTGLTQNVKDLLANALMEQEVPVHMTNFAHILNEMNNSFSGRNEVVDRLCRYPLLIIDDFGMERSTEYALEQIYNIVDSRYRSRKPLIVTTNLTSDEIRHPQDTAHARIYDRLLEMCVPISCIGVSFRKEIAQEKLERLKELIG